jgi:hypothetical protein
MVRIAAKLFNSLDRVNLLYAQIGKSGVLVLKLRNAQFALWNGPTCMLLFLPMISSIEEMCLRVFLFLSFEMEFKHAILSGSLQTGRNTLEI